MSYKYYPFCFNFSHLYIQYFRKFFNYSEFLKKITMDANKMRPILDFTFILQKFVRSCCICRRSTWICMYRPDAFYSSITICSTLYNLGTLLNFCMTLPLVYSLYYCSHCRCFSIAFDVFKYIRKNIYFTL